MALLAGCLLALASALAVVLARRPVHAALALLAHSLSLAILFAILSAGMVAVGQVIIYSGAIVVLFLLVVTLLPTGGAEVAPPGGRVAAAIVAAGALLVAFGAALGATAGAVPPTAAPGDSLGVAAVGRALFGPTLIAFELTAPLLLVAVVGAVAIWRRHEPRSRVAPRPGVGPGRRLVIHR